ncbi:hypothetical protein M1271_04725 [Patescibacteria group bacterium]|nr:hypothetical protein [Patescibacteria group bacterium]MCL5798237.1 hypothetical protein [Patescibacteria group bacterium]
MLDIPMADDSSSRTVRDNQDFSSLPEDTSSPSPPAVNQPTSDSASGDQLVGSDTNRPVSFTPTGESGTIPADSQTTALTSEQTISSDSNRPVSTIPADSGRVQSPTQSADISIQSEPTIPADPVSEVKIPEEIVDSIPAELSAGASAKEDSVSEVQQPEIPVDAKPADSQTDSTNPADPINENQVPVQPEQSSLQPNSDTVQNTGTLPIQVEQVQSEAPNDASISATEIPGVDSAEIQPEPSDSPQIAPSEEKIPEKNNNLSFGDILSGKSDSNTSPLPVQTPVSDTPNPSVSFGDLIDPASAAPSDSPQPATGNSQPVSQQLQQQQSQAPASVPNPPSVSPPTTAPVVPEPVIIEKPVEVIKEVVKEVRVFDEAEVDKRAEERITLEVDSRLQKANRKRIEKREENLNKIIQFLQSKPKANNKNIRDYLHVSQTTATEYLHALVSSGKIRMEGKGKATIYHL